MRRCAILIAVLATVFTGCGTKLPDPSTWPSLLAGDDPRTLEAATAAAQEWADRQAAGDFDGAWLMMSGQVQGGISQADYVILSRECGTGVGDVPLTMTGVRMDGDVRAVVRAKPRGEPVQFTVVYESGKWLMAPDGYFAYDLTKPVNEIVAYRRATGRCTNQMPAPTSGPTAGPSPARGWSDVKEERPGAIAHLSGVRVARREFSDRLIFEFTDRVPGYAVGYRSLPAYADASGEEIPLPGATTMLQISLRPATATGWVGGERTYFGPDTVSGDTATVTELKAAGDFEAVLTWVAGMRGEAPFDVDVLADPPRLVIDVEH
ncbi:AMIN-like domain-containing (lipo)protein [Mycolicibacterium celeriflavum]|uniref:AMIN-like domain-containing (lipo)protein n=1 Tax=Mycolicibacterium celeriflavum TaxID=1249101 RepID=UPI003CFA23D4